MSEEIIQEENINTEIENKRPVVVSVIAVAMLLNGAITLATGLSFEANLYVIASGVVAVLLGFGLWMLWSWSWIGTILMQLVALGVAFYEWYTLGSINFWSIGIAVLIIIYLLRSEIRAAFFS